ncbi:T9SS type B sorting domain-containing protein [Empedobacter tilapiae]|uniref:T9SS type B sorting domain-containing protein n=1 Tax=Empedobacter tilapiae TaxID=2491114 RepID=A0A4Z1BIK1_9FLAO|nr:T9SS type B sorting domain-containing protein [Empedobacter tilapiae]TGN29775.1 T9SS type B sorting domain-containing protein [Empedobacter tilapiae]
MKKIFYFLLLMISGIVCGQRPFINPLRGGFTFENQTLDFYPSTINFTPVVTDGCGFNPTQTYKYFSFEANFDMVFAFDLKAKVPDFKFLTWKLPKGKVAEDVFVGNSTTIKAIRSVEGMFNIKGMNEGDANSCETYSTSGANGYAKAFEGSELLKKGEIVIIAVYGGSTTELFDMKVNVAEDRTVTTFNNLCFGQSYTASQIYNAIQNDSGYNDIKLYTDDTFSTEIPIGTSISSDTRIYAQVRDAAGNLKFIYTIPIVFIPEHQFNFNSTINQIFECSLNYTLNENTLLGLLFPTGTDTSKYIIKTVNGAVFSEGSQINLTTGENKDLKIIVSYTGSCPIDSHEKIIKIQQGTPVIRQIKDDVTCDLTYKISFDYIYSELSKLGIDKAQYDLIVTLGGLPIFNGQATPITTTLDYKVKVKSKIAGCESNEVNFVVTKTQPADIIDASINGICLSDFTQTDVDNAINIIQKGNSFHLRFYQADGITEIVESNLFNYIKTAKNGKIIVKALAVDNGNTICDTEVELNFALDESDIALPTTIPVFEKKCMEAASVTRFEVSEIEKYLEDNVYHQDLEFRNFDLAGYSLNENSELEIAYDLRKAGECWTSSKIIIKTINKPNVIDITQELMADCDDKITIDTQVLSDLFGANSIVDYHYEILHNNSTPLTFDASGKASVKVLFKNKLDNLCFVEKDIIINKKQDLVVDTDALETYTKDHSIIYCEGADENAKNQIQTILDYIKTNYSLTSSKTKDQIFDQFNSNNTEVTIDFEDPNFCGIVSIKFFYQKNTLPDFNIPSSSEICSDTKYILDFEELAKEKGLDVNEYTFVVNGFDKTQISIYKYELGVGDYTITISNKDSGCPKEFTLKLLNSEIPIINKITINEKSIIVSAKGNGKLEYALFDSTGKVIVEWQTNNELMIPDNIRDNDFTVKVRLKNCGVSERKNVIYLSLPNVVTPNSDGFNDVWQPMTKDGKVSDTSNSYKLIIFDRFGKQILSQEGIGIIKWDGTLNGKPVADGTYWYMLEFSKQSDDMQVLYSGSILLKRKIK